MTPPTPQAHGNGADEALRLECARLVAVFTNGEGCQVEKTRKLYEFLCEDAAVGDLATRDDMRRLLRRAAVDCGSGRRLAAKAGVSEPYVSQVLSGEKPPGLKLLDMLGYEAVTMYRRVG